MSPPPDAERTIRPAIPIDLGLTLGLLRRGRADPCMRIGPDGVWRATRTPAGPVTTRITAGAGGLTMRAWGAGSSWAVDAFPALVGAGDDGGGFVPRDPVVRDLHRSLPGVRIPRSAAVVEALVPSILEQKVVGLEARRSYARLVRALGEPAPGPPEAWLTLPPGPATLARMPYHVFHRFGVERKRADAVRAACSYAHRLEETVAMAPAAAARRLTALPGVGPWTAAEVARVALGDTDAVSVGDYHLPHQVAWALAGEARADDSRMLELLEPYRGHRARVVRLIECAGVVAPRFGPRMPLRSIASI
ncbi:MAG: DNA-3-methyladenine glycosylase 2 family protein [Actinomycetota bacterium]|nr:DNA-3-methyladenine glycosylase 2 family protein [Actinomycetota bacterium]